MPPGAITNPGRAAIKAAMNPLKTGELYFVADGKGGHTFAKNLLEHNKNVAKWRQMTKWQGFVFGMGLTRIQFITYLRANQVTSSLYPRVMPIRIR